MTREFRLKQLIEEHHKRLKSWVALEEAIAQAHAKAPKSAWKREYRVDRRKLQRIVEGEDVCFHISELEALDDYFNNHHEGLAYVPIFVRPTLLPTLVAQKHVHLLVGARDVHNSLSVSHFDTNAHADIVRQLNSQSPGVAAELELVLLRATREEARAIQNETWQRTLSSEKAVIAVASPVANHGTDLMLSQMFRCTPYEEPAPARWRPEIAFVLHDAVLARTFSSFVEGPEQLRLLDPAKALEIGERRWALRLGDEVFLSDSEDQQNSKTYGVIVAQRRASGQIWVVAAGLHGAGTHAAALALPRAEINLWTGRPGEDGQVHVRVVEARVTFTTSSTGTKIRKVQEQRILTKFNRAFYPRPGPF
jgi:hypothetical protein